MVLEGTNDIRAQVPGGLRAQALFQILVGPDGVSLEYNLISSSGNEMVNDMGAELARSIEFRPATRFGCGVVGWFEFPVRINL